MHKASRRSALEPGRRASNLEWLSLEPSKQASNSLRIQKFWYFSVSSSFVSARIRQLLRFAPCRPACLMFVFYTDTQRTIQECRERLHHLQNQYQQMQTKFEERLQQFRDVYAQHLEGRKVDAILELLQDAKNLSQTADNLMHQKDFHGAIERLKFLDTMLHKPPLSDLKALDELRSSAMQRLERCHKNIVAELE